MARALLSFFVPGGLLFLVAVGLAASGWGEKMAPALLELLPYGIWGAGILLGWRFNRSRLVFALVVLALAERALWYAAGLPAEAGEVVYKAAALLVPLNLMAIFLFKERGVVAGRGMWRLSLIFLQPVVLAALYRYFPAEVQQYLAAQPLSLPWEGKFALPQPALFAFGGALLLFLAALFYRKRRRALENGFFWATVAAAGAFVLDPGLFSTIYLAMSGLILIVAVLEVAYGMAFRDELTGLPARRALNEALLRLGSNYAVAMLDIDFFKKFNDKHGHDVGDQVLCMVATKLEQVSGGGKAFRYGGEEFTVLYPGKSAREALPYLEQLRETIASTDFIIRGKNRPRIKPRNKKKIRGSRKKAPITVSIGVADKNGRQVRAQEVVKAADKALYRAKQAGRNRVAI